MRELSAIWFFDAWFGAYVSARVCGRVFTILRTHVQHAPETVVKARYNNTPPPLMQKQKQPNFI